MGGIPHIGRLLRGSKDFLASTQKSQEMSPIGNWVSGRTNECYFGINPVAQWTNFHHVVEGWHVVWLIPLELHHQTSMVLMCCQMPRKAVKTTNHISQHLSSTHDQVLLLPCMEYCLYSCGGFLKYGHPQPSSIFSVAFSIINQPFWGTLIYGNHHMWFHWFLWCAMGNMDNKWWSWNIGSARKSGARKALSTSLGCWKQEVQRCESRLTTRLLKGSNPRTGLFLVY